ncbi:MAG: sensor histidine kinase, partial [Bacteroidetes bacterium]|nr:sensor histidine kinase [Bacteroidota bacterium]
SVVFHVLDSGQGFQKSSLILCVKPGDRMSISSSDTHSAVSLILARKLVGLMNGEIWIEKNGVSGTGVYFSLPVKEPASKPGSFSHEIRTRMAI